MEQRHTDINTETIICLRVDQVRGFRVLSEPFNTHELTESFTPSLFINTHFASHLWQKYKGPKVPGGNASPPQTARNPSVCMYNMYVCICMYVCMYVYHDREIVATGVFLYLFPPLLEDGAWGYDESDP